MRVKIPLLLLLLMAAAIGYLLGTERGRAQRDVVLVKLGRKSGDEEEPTQGADTVATDTAETVAEETDTAAGEATEPTG